MKELRELEFEHFHHAHPPHLHKPDLDLSNISFDDSPGISDLLGDHPVVCAIAAVGGLAAPISDH